MSLFLYLFMIFLEFSFNYEITPIENFEKKIVSFNETKDYVIYSYFIPSSSKYTTYYHNLRKDYYGSRYIIQDFYVYDKLSKIKQDSKGDFINYVKKYSFRRYSSQIGFQDSFYENKTYYFVIKNTQVLNETMNFTLTLTTSEAIGILHNFIQAQMEVYKNGTYNYKINIPPEHKKYILFEIETNMMANIILIDNNKEIISKSDSFSGASYFKLKEGYSYNINLSFVGNGTYRDGEIYFYFIQSKYTKFFPLIMNTEYLQRLYVNRKLKLLLDLSSIKKGDMIWVRYDRSWGWFSYFRLRYYNTDDEDKIEKTEGNEIQLSYDEKCENFICKEYLHKNTDEIKVVIFEVPYDIQKNIFYFEIAYGNPEKYRLQTIYISLIIGISLSIPNLLVQIIFWGRDKECKCHHKCALIMDIILHMTYGCLLSVAVYLGGRVSRIIGFSCLAAFGFLLLINVILSMKRKQSILSGLIILLHKFENYRTFEKAFNERKKLPPQIILSNKEIIDNDNDNNNIIKEEYKYSSWEDGTNFVLNKDNPILSCNFDYSINLDSETREDLTNYKNDLENKEISNDNNEQKMKKYYEHFLVPNFNVFEICTLEPTNIKDKLFLFIWFLSLLTGYLDIFELFLYHDKEVINVRVIKKVSKRKKYKVGYKLNDEKYEDNDIFDKNGKNESIENIDLKIEPILNNHED